MPKKTGKRRSHPANAKRGNGRAKTGPAPGDAQDARAFDLIVRDLPTDVDRKGQRPSGTGRSIRNGRGFGDDSAVVHSPSIGRGHAQRNRKENHGITPADAA